MYSSGVLKRNGKVMRKKRASPYLTYQAAGFARGPVHATVVSSRTPVPRMGLCTRMELCRHADSAAALGTGAAVAAQTVKFTVVARDVYFLRLDD